MTSIKEQAQAIADFKEQSAEELANEVSNDSVEMTLQKIEKNELSPSQEDYILEVSREEHFENKK